jgi:hypothetical protein
VTRTLLVLACVVFVLLLLAGMWWGWTNRGKRQADLPGLPEVPATLSAALLAPLTGLYVGTTFASSWQDRVVHGGLGVQAEVAASWHPEGLLLDRAGAEPIFIPVAAITGARLAPGLAGRVVGAGGLLVVSWNLGEHALDTGIRADDKSAYPTWVRTIEASSDESTRSETANSPSLIKEIRHSAEGEDQ